MAHWYQTEILSALLQLSPNERNAVPEQTPMCIHEYIFSYTVVGTMMFHVFSYIR